MVCSVYYYELVVIGCWVVILSAVYILCTGE